MCCSHILQCKIKGEIKQTQIEILKIPMVGHFYLINLSKWYHVYKNPTINLRDMKYGRYTLNTLKVYSTCIIIFLTYFETHVSMVLTWHAVLVFIVLSKQQAEGTEDLFLLGSHRIWQWIELTFKME
jgi:hypothetical protein